MSSTDLTATARTLTIQLEPGEVICRIPAEIAGNEDWHEFAAYRLVRLTADEVRLQLAHNLDSVTDPAVDCDACTGKGYVVQAGPGHVDHRIKCRECDGSGRAAN